MGVKLFTGPGHRFISQKKGGAHDQEQKSFYDCRRGGGSVEVKWEELPKQGGLTMSAHFMEELLREAEEREAKERVDVDRLRADQMLAAIAELERQMNDVLELVNAEVALLEEYRTKELSRLDKKLSWLAFNLEGFMRSTTEKTLRLPHGVLKLRKTRDRIVVASMEKFLKHPGYQTMMRRIPESFEPDMEAIWTYHSRTGGSVPDGCQFIPAEVKFSYTTTEATNGTDTDETERQAQAGTSA